MSISKLPPQRFITYIPTSSERVAAYPCPCPHSTSSDFWPRQSQQRVKYPSVVLICIFLRYRWYWTPCMLKSHLLVIIETLNLSFSYKLSWLWWKNLINENKHLLFSMEINFGKILYFRFMWTYLVWLFKPFV